jgi:iron(III) transport system substrate-binding protein
VPGVDGSEAARAAGLPADISTVLANVDFDASAKQQIEIKAEWRDRFGR